MIREKTGHNQSLDDVMRVLWQRYGKNFYHGDAHGITDADAKAIIESVCGEDCTEFFNRYIDGTDLLPLPELFAPFGITLLDTATSIPGLDIRVRRSGSDCVVTHVFEGGTAHRAGIAAGDVLLAIDGLRVSADNPAANLEKQLSSYNAGETIRIHVFRRDELMQFEVTLADEHIPKYTLSASEEETASMREARRNWLHLPAA